MSVYEGPKSLTQWSITLIYWEKDLEIEIFTTFISTIWVEGTGKHKSAANRRFGNIKKNTFRYQVKTKQADQAGR